VPQYGTSTNGSQDSGQRLIIVLDPQAPNFGASAEGAFCTCNTDFVECDPDASVGELNACQNPNGVNERVPLDIQGVEDPDSYICRTLGGRRVCFSSAAFQ
jgi:hypothetical protein